MMLRVLTRTLSSLFRLVAFRKPGWLRAEAWTGKKCVKDQQSQSCCLQSQHSLVVYICAILKEYTVLKKTIHKIKNSYLQRRFIPLFFPVKNDNTNNIIVKTGLTLFINYTNRDSLLFGQHLHQFIAPRQTGWAMNTNVTFFQHTSPGQALCLWSCCHFIDHAC